VPLLFEAGTLPAEASIRCPGNGDSMSCQVSLAALRAMTDGEFTLRAPSLSMCYAYSLGYRDAEGTYHAPGPAPNGLLSASPIMADRPPAEGVVKNSVNHGGMGQNVLFSDGHVVFLPERTYGDGDDIFLNRDHKVAAGLGATDVVLGFSAARP
jgi:prepilin-type processing-associated H-X9-DG protein